MGESSKHLDFFQIFRQITLFSQNKYSSTTNQLGPKVPKLLVHSLQPFKISQVGMTNRFMTLIAKLVYNAKYSLLEEGQKLIKKFYFIKYLFQSNFIFSQCHGNVKVEPRPPSISAFNEGKLKMTEVNLKNVQSQRRDQENGEDGSHGAKKEQRFTQRDSSPKRDKSHKKRKTGKQSR